MSMDLNTCTEYRKQACNISLMPFMQDGSQLEKNKGLQWAGSNVENLSMNAPRIQCMLLILPTFFPSFASFPFYKVQLWRHCTEITLKWMIMIPLHNKWYIKCSNQVNSLHKGKFATHVGNAQWHHMYTSMLWWVQFTTRAALHMYVQHMSSNSHGLVISVHFMNEVYPKERRLYTCSRTKWQL